MSTLVRRLRSMLATLVLILAMGATVPAWTQPAPTNPDANAVKEEQLLQRLAPIQGRIDIPNKRESVLIQPAGRIWRLYHEIVLNWFGLAAVGGAIALLALVYFVRGPIRIEAGRCGRMILRFNGFERFIHWLAGTTFIVLALTGLNFTYGKKVLLPVVGLEAFSHLAEVGKYAHNFLSFPFVLGVIVMFFVWIKENLPTAADVEWLKEGGGFVGSTHPPAWRFNAGQKLLFWGIVFATVLMAVSGYLLMFPFYLTGIAGMQIAEIVHSVGAVLFIAAVIAHLYLGTFGIEGGFDAMADGYVDLNWATQHHRLWVEKTLGRVPMTSPSSDAVVTPAE